MNAFGLSGTSPKERQRCANMPAQGNALGLPPSGASPERANHDSTALSGLAASFVKPRALPWAGMFAGLWPSERKFGCGALVALMAVVAPSFAASLTCEGVLGNSGEQGTALVRFAAEPAKGMGVAYDRFGSLWDRGGAGVLNRYALDGRLLGTYRIAKEAGDSDQLALAGDTLVLLIRGALFTLPITAPAGAEAQPLKVSADAISFHANSTQLAARSKDDVFLFDTVTGTKTPVATVKGASELELGPDGAVYVAAGGKLRKFVNGAEVTEGWPKGRPGDRAQLLDGFWFGHAWHTTIRRFTAQMEPAPGVALGGSSGSFIGHLDQNADLFIGRGLAKVRDNVFAVSGVSGIPQLLEWQDDRQQFEIVRRLGSVPVCRGLGLDRAGNVWHLAGTWRWEDGPDAPMRLGINSLDHPGIGPAAMLDDDTLVAPGSLWGKPTIVSGKLTKEVSAQRIEKATALPLKDTCGSVIYRRENRLLLLVLDAAGKAQSFNLSNEGRYVSDAGPVELKTVTPVKTWTALAMRDAGTLLAAADGAVIEFEPDGGVNWIEKRRWNSWGAQADEKFGATIAISADTGRLWVADRERQRVLCFDLATGKLLAAFGIPDKPGDDLGTLNAPETIAARGERAVVFDRGNQRLVKLRFKAL